MRAKKKCNPKFRRLKRATICVISIILFIVIFFEITIKDRIELVIIAQIKSISYSTVDEVVSEYITNNKQLCDDMISIVYDDSNNVKSITEDASNVNIFKTKVTELSKSSIDEIMKVYGIEVKLGNFTGLNIISDIGPSIPIDVDATTTIKCKIRSEFVTAGINQTLHRCVLSVYGDIYVGNPIRIESIKFKTNFEISQTIIVGTMPSTYGTISRY